MPMRWYGPECTLKLRAAVGIRFDKAARTLRDYIREKLSVPNVVIGWNRMKYGPIKGTRGSQPSKPGEYPRKLTGNLRRNVQSETDREALVARVGTNVPYGKYLELGTRKMLPRPWLSRGLTEIWSTLRKIVGGG